MRNRIDNTVNFTDKRKEAKEIYWNSVRRVSSAKETLSRSVDNRVKGGVDGYIVATLLIVITVVVGVAININKVL